MGGRNAPASGLSDAGILACVDGSAYAASVADHAAWFRSRGGGRQVTLLHASSDEAHAHPGQALLSALRGRLQDQGVSDVRTYATRGPFQTALAGASADLLVLGKRGEESLESGGALGANAAAVLRTYAQPLCLVSRLFLPIHRGLVLIDADPCHRQAIETVAATDALREMELDIVMMQPEGEDGSAKLAWARDMLGGGRADIYPMAQATPEAVAARYMARHGIDLVVFSREMMFAPRQTGETLEHRPVWSWRAPVFVC